MLQLRLRDEGNSYERRQDHEFTICMSRPCLWSWQRMSSLVCLPSPSRTLHMRILGRSLHDIPIPALIMSCGQKGWWFDRCQGRPEHYFPAYEGQKPKWSRCSSGLWVGCEQASNAFKVLQRIKSYNMPNPNIKSLPIPRSEISTAFSLFCLLTIVFLFFTSLTL